MGMVIMWLFILGIDITVAILNNPDPISSACAGFAFGALVYAAIPYYREHRV